MAEYPAATLKVEYETALRVTWRNMHRYRRMRAENPAPWVANMADGFKNDLRVLFMVRRWTREATR